MLVVIKIDENYSVYRFNVLSYKLVSWMDIYVVIKLYYLYYIIVIICKLWVLFGFVEIIFDGFYIFFGREI